MWLPMPRRLPVRQPCKVQAAQRMSAVVSNRLTLTVQQQHNLQTRAVVGVFSSMDLKTRRSSLSSNRKTSFSQVSILAMFQKMQTNGEG